MKILIVDDNFERATALKSRLVSRVVRSAIDVEICSHALSARTTLATTAFDLLILDVMLPFRPGDEPSDSTSITLLTELSETSNMSKPRQVIGLTAYEAAERTVASDFAERAWTLVREDSHNDDWMDVVVSAAQYMVDQEAQQEGAGFSEDVAIVTALQLELDAVRRLPWQWSPDQALDDSQFVTRGSFLSNGRRCSVVAGVASRMGMVPAAVLAAKFIETFRPKLLVMTGICAGVRDKVALGDVICADTSWDYQSGKHVSTSGAIRHFLVEPNFIQTDSFVSSRFDQLSRDHVFAARVAHGWSASRQNPPNMHRGPIASGSAVLADPEVTDGIRLQQRKLLGVEMELYGVFYAAGQAKRPKPKVLGLKGVCDYADDQKGDSMQAFAAYASAECMREFCERFVSEL
jgi:nucleoside phosphorylase/CheY-like chemotaxis protein